MDYEKRYNELIDAIKEMRDANPHDEGLQNWVQDNVPELAESEDEKIRKALIELVKFSKRSCFEILKDQSFNIVSMDAMLAWLEKLKVFAEHGDGLYYFGNNGFTYVGNPTCDNVLWTEKQGDKPQGKAALEAAKEEKVDNQNCVKGDDKIGQKFKVGDIVQYITDSTDRRKIEEIDTLCNMYHTDSSPIMFEIEDEWKVVVNAEDVEQKPIDKIKPKFHVGDWIVDKSGFVQRVLNFIGGIYTCTYNDFTTDCESNYHLWTIKDAKPGDVLNANGALFIYKKHDKDCVYSYCGINLADEFVKADDTDTWVNNNSKVCPATEEQRDTFFAKMKEAGCEWDIEKKELKKIDL